MFTNGKDRAEETLLRLLSNPPAIRHISQDKDEIGKATWIRFAKEWLKLADEAEQSTGVTGRCGPEVGGAAFPQPGKADAASASRRRDVADGLRSLAATGPSFDRMLGVQAC